MWRSGWTCQTASPRKSLSLIQHCNFLGAYNNLNRVLGNFIPRLMKRDSRIFGTFSGYIFRSDQVIASLQAVLSGRLKSRRWNECTVGESSQRILGPPRTASPCAYQIEALLFLLFKISFLFFFSQNLLHLEHVLQKNAY